MRYYAAKNMYGSPTSIGFANWEVYVFDDKHSRDQFVLNGDMSTRAIRRNEVTSYAGFGGRGPKPFSGEHWCIDDSDTYLETSPEGLIGKIQVSEPGWAGYDRRERFNK